MRGSCSSAQQVQQQQLLLLLVEHATASRDRGGFIACNSFLSARRLQSVRQLAERKAAFKVRSHVSSYFKGVKQV